MSAVADSPPIDGDVFVPGRGVGGGRESTAEGPHDDDASTPRSLYAGGDVVVRAPFSPPLSADRQDACGIVDRRDGKEEDDDDDHKGDTSEGGGSDKVSAAVASSSFHRGEEVRWRRPLSDPTDASHLSELVCLVRSQIELFAATGEDIEDRWVKGGRGGAAIDVGRIGIRCVHCVAQSRRTAANGASAAGGGKKTARGAVSYPKETRLVYQAVRNWQRYHFFACPFIPAEVKDTYTAHKSREKEEKATMTRKQREGRYPRRRSKNESVDHWVECLRRMGLVDSPDRGIRLGTEGEKEEGEKQKDGGSGTNGGSSSFSVSNAEARQTALVAKSHGIHEASIGQDAQKVVPSYKGKKDTRFRYGVSSAQSENSAPINSSYTSGGAIPEKVAAVTGLAKGSVLPSSAVGATRLVPSPQIASDAVEGLDTSSFRQQRPPPPGQPANPPKNGDGRKVVNSSLPSIAEAAATFAEAATAAAIPFPSRSETAAAVTKNTSAAAWEGNLGDGDLEELMDSMVGSPSLAITVPPEDGIHEEDLVLNNTGPSVKKKENQTNDEEEDINEKELSAGALGEWLRTRFEEESANDPFAASAVQQSHHGSRSSFSGATQWQQQNHLSSGASAAVLTPSPPPALSSICATRPALLERLALAQSTVLTIEGIAPLPTDDGGSSGGGGGSEGGRDVSSPGGEEKKGGVGGRGGEDLRYLGEELYELFAGRPPFDCDDDNDGCGGNGGASLTAVLRHDASSDKVAKKKKATPSGTGGVERGRNRYVPLRELGIPSTSLCALVSSLLGCEDCGDNGGNEPPRYSSIKEVKEDLGLMTSQPDRYCFDDPSLLSYGVNPQFEIPRDALYGREREVRIISDAYDRASGSKSGPPESGSREPATNVLATREMVLLSGYSGSGKSEIMRRALGGLAKCGARVMSGKFDVVQRVQPLSAVVSALDEFFGRWLSGAWQGSGGGLNNEVRARLGEALGGEAKVLTDLIPNLGAVIGLSDPSSTVQIGGRQAKQRLFFLFRRLFRFLRSHMGGTVVLALDDLQWADEPSLELIRVLTVDTNDKGLLFIGTYRDNEVDLGDSSDHPLARHLAEMQKLSGVGGLNITTVAVGNLTQDDVSVLLSDSLRVLPRATARLAEVVVRKTGGNALFVVQFLHSLYYEGLLRFSLSTRRWEWDIAKIRSRDIADNVVELMTEKLLRLPDHVRGALAKASVFGAKCNQIICDILDRGDVPNTLDAQGHEGFADSLDVAVAEGLVVREGGSNTGGGESRVGGWRAGRGSGAAHTGGQTYRFHHDQIQLAAYQLIPPIDREAFHLKIGRSLWKLSSPEELEQFLFVVVDQLHRGRNLIVGSEEKTAFAGLCLMAGRSAMAMSAFLPAKTYLNAGIDLLSDEDWYIPCRDGRELCLDLYSLCAETEFLLGDFVGMQAHLDEVFLRASTLKEKIRAYSTQVQSLGYQQKKKDALCTALGVLKELGEFLPSTISTELVFTEVLRTRQALERIDIDSLHKKEAMVDPDKIEAMKFLRYLSVFTFGTHHGYFALSLCRRVCLSLSHGLCKESPIAFGGIGAILCANGHVSLGFRLGKVALATVERFEAKEYVPRVYLTIYAFINYFYQPVQSNMTCLKEAAEVGLSLGDPENTMSIAQTYIGLALQSGQPLVPLVEEMRSYSQQMMQRNPMSDMWIHACRQFTANLLGRSSCPHRLVGEEMNEHTLLLIVERSALVAEIIYFFSTWLAYLFGEYELASETAEKSRNVGKKDQIFICKFFTLYNHVFYSGLTALVLARRQHHGQRRQVWLSTIDSSIRQMEELAELCAWNFAHKLELLQAEYAYLTGDCAMAASKYDRAAELAASHRFVHEEALALERAGLFYSETGDRVAASRYFARACACYAKWGASSKVAHIQEHYL